MNTTIARVEVANDNDRGILKQVTLINSTEITSISRLRHVPLNCARAGYSALMHQENCYDNSKTSISNTNYSR